MSSKKKRSLDPMLIWELAISAQQQDIIPDVVKVDEDLGDQVESEVGEASGFDMSEPDDEVGFQGDICVAQMVQRLEADTGADVPVPLPHGER